MAKAQSKRKRGPWYTVLYIQVLLAVVIGCLIGALFPKTGMALKPLGDSFVALIRMMIAPVIFCVIVQGIASMSDLKKVGTIGIKTLIYFEVVSTLALIIGIVVAVVIHPGAGLNIDAATLDPKAAAVFVGRAKETGFIPFLLAFIPRTFVGALAEGEVPQVLLISILTGFAIANLGEIGQRALQGIELANKVVFGIVRIVVRAAPLGALGGMAFTVGSYGIASLTNLLKLMGTFYLSSILFVVFVLGTIAYFAGFSIFRFLAYIKDELLIVLGTSSSETVLPDMMRKLEASGSAAQHRGTGISDGLCVQHRRHKYLSDSGGAISGAGHQHASFARADWRDSVVRAGGFQGRLWRDGHGICDVGGDSGRSAIDSGDVAGTVGGDRKIHE